jgi:hypothetical protein
MSGKSYEISKSTSLSRPESNFDPLQERQRAQQAATTERPDSPTIPEDPNNTASRRRRRQERREAYTTTDTPPTPRLRAVEPADRPTRSDFNAQRRRQTEEYQPTGSDTSSRIPSRNIHEDVANAAIQFGLPHLADILRRPPSKS